MPVRRYLKHGHTEGRRDILREKCPFANGSRVTDFYHVDYGGSFRVETIQRPDCVGIAMTLFYELERH